MHIRAYTFEADVHCPVCTRKRFGWRGAVRKNMLAKGLADECGVSNYALDSERNPVRPVFDIDEDLDGTFTHCGDCHEPLS